MKKINAFIIFLTFILCCGYSVSAVTPTEPELTSADRDYLVRAVASSFPDVSFAARVGIISVVINRITSEGYPDTAAGAIASLDGSFPLYRISSHRPDSKTLRITEDALEAVLAGGRPVGSCKSFVFHERALKGSGLSARIPLDLFFDNSAERKMKKEILDTLDSCSVIIDGVGFYDDE